MSQEPPVLVIGGTRGTGLLIARLLDGRGTPVRVLARDRVRAEARLGPTVDVVSGDITRSETLPPALHSARHIVFTAGCRSGHPARESRIKATEYDGVLNTLAAAKAAGFTGRFLYMTSSGVTTVTFATRCLNFYKGNTLVWRRRAEEQIRASGFAYTIIRTGMLLNRRPGRAIRLTQTALPLLPRYRIGRADVAEAFVAALDHPRAAGATFEIVWSRGQRQEPWSALLANLRPDP